MASGIWIPTSGATAQSKKLESISNNLANIDTPSFKKDLPVFKTYLAIEEKGQPVSDIPRGPIKDKEFYPLDGRDQSYVVLQGTYTNHKQGHLKTTNSPLDVALDGPGFLEVRTPQGVRWTRQGSLQLNSNGVLTTQQGYPILGIPISEELEAHQTESKITQIPAEGRFIHLTDYGANFEITPSGEIYSGDQLVARFHLVEFENLNRLKKQGDGLFVNDGRSPLLASKTHILQGVIEGSNVNPVEEMSQMIQTHRLFEQDLKALKTYGELLNKEVNEVGKL